MDHLKEYAARILDYFRKRNAKKLRKLTDKIMKKAALDPSKRIYHLSVISYVLGKIISKPRYTREEFLQKMGRIETLLIELNRIIESPNEEKVKNLFERIEDAIKKIEEKDERYVDSLIIKGKTKIAATMYAQGLSLGVASEMTGISKHDILEYAGKTMMFERVKEEKTMEERMKKARELLRG